MGPTIMQVTLPWPSVAAGTDDERGVAIAAPGEWRLVAAYWCPDTAITANATNYTTLTVKQGSTTLATRATDVAGGSAVKHTAEALTLSGGAALEFGQGDVIQVDKDDSGTGAIVDGAFSFFFEKYST